MILQKIRKYLLLVGAYIFICTPLQVAFAITEEAINTQNNSSSDIEELFAEHIKHKQTDDPIYMDCRVTPQIEPSYIPLKAVKKSGNLIRKPGYPDRAKGSYIMISGKVIDEDCLPISNAIIRIWQTDRFGKTEENYQLKSKWDVQDKLFDPNFAFSGTAYTNNVGEFSFITILPGSIDDEKAPHINMSVRHSEFGDVDTKLFFEKHPRNKKDPDLMKLSKDERNRVIMVGEKIDPTGRIEGRVYNTVITLEGVNKFKRF